MGLEDDIRTLERAPLFREIGREALRLLAFSAEPLRLVTGAVLFEKGERANGGFVVVRGSIALASDGRPPRVVGAGALIGELALVIETERPVTATAREPSVVLTIPRASFHRMLEEYPRVAAALRSRVAARILADGAALDEVHARLSRLCFPGSRSA